MSDKLATDVKARGAGIARDSRDAFQEGAAAAVLRVDWKACPYKGSDPRRRSWHKAWFLATEHVMVRQPDAGGA